MAARGERALLRLFCKCLPKRNGFDDFDQRELDEINRRLRKCLGWLSPAEALSGTILESGHTLLHYELELRV